MVKQMGKKRKRKKKLKNEVISQMIRHKKKSLHPHPCQHKSPKDRPTDYTGDQLLQKWHRRERL